MKKCAAVFLIIALLAAMVSGCTPAQKQTELIVFAAASMTETLSQLGDAYMKEHSNVTIVFNFDSSGTLKTQIQEGAEIDHCILDKQSVIRRNGRLIAPAAYPIVIAKNVVI